jgi:low temperature requirement protein LtrA
MGFTFYANRFDTDDLPYRLLTLLGMFLVAVLATTVRSVFEGHSSGFVVAYLGVRLILLVLYERARRHVPEARRLAVIFLAAFGAAAGFWLVSLALPAPWRYWLWGVALVLELGAPLFAWRQLPNAPIHPRHIPERFGLLTLIVLGESVLGVVLGIAHVPWGAASGAAASGGFVAAAALWWIYFDFLDETTISARGLWGGLTYTYMHYFVVVGLAAMGAGVKLAILAAGGESRYDGTSWILCAGLALRLGTAVLALVLVPFGLSPLLVVLVLAGVLVAQVAYELLEHEGHAGQVASRPAPPGPA